MQRYLCLLKAAQLGQAVADLGPQSWGKLRYVVGRHVEGSLECLIVLLGCHVVLRARKVLRYGLSKMSGQKRRAVLDSFNGQYQESLHNTPKAPHRLKPNLF